MHGSVARPARRRHAPLQQPGVAHASFVEEPEHAAAVTRAIRVVVVAVRTGAPLTKP